ncbi:thiolase family protein [Falsibacillus albus]|uniref:Thiolase family protein n=1 Tax=Falsibacillus albus TaxID=2478915 RepID=A0A3L7K4X9_9BACI|nr:thiolase family protein [Falsibacillus albus]RLQ97329.1 thiolase family protein [Falsibacillus albus]
MNRAVIVAGKRTPIGKVGGILKEFEPQDLAAPLIQAIVKETNLPMDEIDDVILGNTVGPGGNLARLSSLTAGLPVDIPGMTIDRQCGSGLEAVISACRLVQAGAGEIYLAGGVESVSLAPWKMKKAKSPYAAPTLFTRARFSPDFIGDPDMGVAAENVAEKYQISRGEQDRFAFNSHQKALKAQDAGRFEEEIVPLKGIEMDECPRRDTSLDKLGQLAPVFVADGSVTAGNSCPINDGAALVLVMSEKKAESLGIRGVMQFVDSTVSGVDPNILGIGPVPAVQRLLSKVKMPIDQIDLIEFNEAFASQVLASIQELQIDENKVNIGGGAIALGHPYGASGAILVTRLLHEMKNGHGSTGLATLGIGGGMGLAAMFERMRT